MSERKYTDEQIVKALECCQSHTITDCRDCPNRASGDNCVNELMRNALDLIKRQKAEIAVLTTAVDNSTKEFLKLHDEYQDQKADIDKLQEVNADLNESLRLAAEANKDLKAEVEEWKARANDWQNQYLKLIEEMEIYQEHIDQDIIYAKAIKAEVIKEFAKKLHKAINDFRDKREMVMLPYTESALLIIERKIDNLVAEMTEGK